MKTPAIILIVIGLAIVIWSAFGFKTKEKVLDIGPIEATKETEHSVPYGPLAGFVVIGAGAALLLKGRS